MAELHKNLYAMTFVHDAIEDYIAFRILLKEEQIKNSLSFAVTSVEKLLKGFAFFYLKKKVSYKKHDPSLIYNEFCSIYNDHGISLSQELLPWLGVVYKMRYTSEMQDTSIRFGRNYLLADIDKFFFESMAILREIDYEVVAPYYSEANFKFISEDNYIYSKKEYVEFVQSSQCVYSIVAAEGRRWEVRVNLTVCRPQKKYYSGNLEVVDGDIHLDIDVGEISVMDLPPKYYLSLQSKSGLGLG